MIFKFQQIWTNVSSNKKERHYPGQLKYHIFLLLKKEKKKNSIFISIKFVSLKLIYCIISLNLFSFAQPAKKLKTLSAVFYNWILDKYCLCLNRKNDYWIYNVSDRI